jgi:hypothetical protein
MRRAHNQKRNGSIMRITLKALGLALVAALAMSVFAAGAAQAESTEFTAEGEVASVAKGSQEEGQANYFEGTSEEKVECSTADYQSTLGAGSTTITVTPHYSGCSKGGTGVSVTLNGCHYIFHTPTTETHGEETTQIPATSDVVCPEGNSITISGPFGICVDHIEPQAGLEGVTFTNIENAEGDQVTVDVNIKDQIAFNHTDTAFCPWTATETRTDGDFVSSVLMTGYTDPNELTTGPTGEETTYKEGTRIGIHVK